MSVAGYSHRKAEAGCQDASIPSAAGPSAGLYSAEHVVLAVADGAGSKRFSAEGAAVAVWLAGTLFGPELLKEFPALSAIGRGAVADHARDVLKQAFGKLVRAFTQEIAKRAADVPDAEPADYATTLTVVVLLSGVLLYASLGDGFALVRAGTEEDEPQIHLLPMPASRSEYANETVFLTSEGAEQRVVVQCVVDAGITGVLLSTDGLAQAMLTDADGRFGRPNVALVNGLLDLLDSGTKEEQDEVRLLLESDRYARTSGDDMTVVRAVRVS